MDKKYVIYLKLKYYSAMKTKDILNFSGRDESWEYQDSQKDTNSMYAHIIEYLP